MGKTMIGYCQEVSKSMLSWLGQGNGVDLLEYALSGMPRQHGDVPVDAWKNVP